jgi:hypothetical protein
MSDAAQPPPEIAEKKSRGLGSYVLWAFFVVMMYVLSIGPVEALIYSRRIDRRISMVYIPLDWAYGKTFLHKPLGIYLHLWCPRVWDSRGEPIRRNRNGTPV